VTRLYPGFERAKAWLDARGTDLHRYGTVDEHDAAHGLDPASLRAAITLHLTAPTAAQFGAI